MAVGGRSFDDGLGGGEGGVEHVLHPHREALREMGRREESDLGDLQRIDRSGRRRIDFARHDDRDRMKTRIPVRPRVDPDQPANGDPLNSCLLFEFARPSRWQGLAALVRPPGPRPVVHVGATHEENAAVSCLRADRSDADDWPPEEMT